jgi:2-methylcitrate dehydratase
MTDHSTREIARQCRELTIDDIPDARVDDAASRLIDTLGCAAGGFGSPPARVAEGLAARHSGTPSARILGTGASTSVEMAAFANGVMARYLDYNDTYTGTSAGHPSDMIPALLATAESVRAGGPELIRSIIAGYEVFGVIGRHNQIRSRGWDQGVLVGLATAAGTGCLLGLGQEQFENAIGLAATMAMPTRSTRAGALSMWKGAATAASARFGVFAAQLAAEGMTAPDRAIEGKDGLWQQITGEFEVSPFGAEGIWAVAETAIKQFPLEYNAQIGVELIREIRQDVTAADVEWIQVDTYWAAYDEIGNEPEKWDPRTRETADHSLPYLLSVGLTDGEVTTDSFDERHLSDPVLRDLMSRVRVAEDPSFTARWPSEVPCRVIVHTRDGRELAREQPYPLGHPMRPLPADRLKDKFVRLTAPRLGDERAEAAFARLSAAMQALDVAELVDLFVTERGPLSDSAQLNVPQSDASSTRRKA